MSGEKVNTRNIIFIATSNAGAETIFNMVEEGKNPKDAQQEINSEIVGKGIFKPELINRFDATIIFHPLTKDNLLKIAQLSLESFKRNLEEREIDFQITDSLKERIVDLSYKPEFGAREMRRVIQDKVENAVASALLSDTIKKGDKIEVNSETFELIINPPKQNL